MFDPTEDVTDPELAEEINEECSNYGKVEFVKLHRELVPGTESEIWVYIIYETPEGKETK